ncbi:Transcription initiation factor TFIID subunit 9B [Taenia crassiceps]|uniref:Transcription initiation factor TFIID subunit 9B n=1 Tax=Taenia crassiceps TaxID=6207 RepID=A0ABR4QNS0_9CEST
MRARFDVVCDIMDGSEQHSGDHLSVLSVIKSIFEDFNLFDLSEDVYNHVLDIISKYTGEILVDAKYNALYAGRSYIAERDLDLAVENKLESVILAPLHRGQLLEYAGKINSQALPSIKSGPGLKLAPEKYTITAPNYCIASNTGASATFANVSGSMNVPPRIVLPTSNASASSGGLAVYRVSNTPGGNPQGQRGTVVSASSTNSSTLSDLPGSAIHVITPGNASASLIRVQSSTFAQSGHPLVCSTTPNSTNNTSNLRRQFSEE